MLKTFTLISLLITSVLVDARDFNPAMGVVDDAARPFFSVSDFNSFPLNVRDRFGMYRYGFGTGHMVLGAESAGYGGKARNGYTIIGLDRKYGVAPHVGLEIFNAEFKVNSNRAFNNYYMWQPAIAAGMMADAGFIGLMMNLKAGGSATNYYIPSGWDPKYDPTYGYGGQLDMMFTSITYDVTNFHNLKREIIDININNVIHLFKEHDETNTILGIGIRKGI